jgi:malate dehydrogenase
MKIGFIGAGRIGSTSAFACLLRMEIDEIVLVDIVKDLVVGEAMDLRHAAAAIDLYPSIIGGTDYSLLEGCEVIVVSAGVARKPGMSRLDLAVKNAEIIKGIAKRIMGLEGKILVVTNPMDLMTYIMWKESKKERNEVFGMGNLLDVSRLKDQLNTSGIKEAKPFIIGEHGDSMFLAKSIADLPEIDFEDIMNKTRFVAAEVIRRKGATFYGPAACIYRMVRAVIEDTKEEIPTSVVLHGEYGIESVAVGVPVILGKNGVEKIIEYRLSNDELKALHNSANILKKKLKKLGY